LATTNLSQLATGVSVRVGKPGEATASDSTGQGRQGRGGRRGDGARE
jgi:hypothetical protein